MVPRLVAALSLLAVSAPAFAGVDVVPTITPPSGTHVYESGRWYVTVSNTGSNNASNVAVSFTLPQTGTSPGTYILGTLDGNTAGCTVSGVTVSCTIGTIKARKTATPLYFDLTLPESTRTLTLTATVTTTSSESAAARANNTTSTNASLNNYDVSFGADIDTVNRHCTGTTSLSSFYECELYPSSISEHQAVLNADGSISFPTESADYGGSWTSDAPDHLVFEYTYLGTPVANFEGWGVSTDCWEGVTTFPSNPTYVSPYEVCVQ